MSDAPLDPSVVEELRQLGAPGEPDVLREVLGLFRDGGPARVAAIRAACAARDAMALQRSAHEFKGAAAAIGALRLQQRCRDLEMAGKNGTVENTTQLLADLDVEYARVQEAIRNLLG